MSSPGKVQLNLRVDPALRDACNRVADRAGLSLNLWAVDVLDRAVGAARTDRLVAEAPPLIPGQTSIVEELEPSPVTTEEPGACPECGGEMQDYCDVNDRMTLRCEDCGYFAEPA